MTTRCGCTDRSLPRMQTVIEPIERCGGGCHQMGDNHGTDVNGQMSQHNCLRALCPTPMKGVEYPPRWLAQRQVRDVQLSVFIELVIKICTPLRLVTSEPLHTGRQSHWNSATGRLCQCALRQISECFTRPISILSLWPWIAAVCCQSSQSQGCALLAAVTISDRTHTMHALIWTYISTMVRCTGNSV